MSILTWRDVATPNLAPASEGIANATDAMNRAFASATGTVDGFKDQRANVADRNILNRAIQYQNPDDLAAAIHDGSVVGSDGQYAHPGTIAGLRSQVTDLLANALTKTQTQQDQANIGNVQANTRSSTVNTDQMAILNARTNADDAAYRAATPTLTGLINKYTPQGAAGITDATKELESSPAFARLNPTQQAAARSSLYSGIAAPVDAGNALYTNTQAGIKAKATTAAEAQVRSLDQLKTQEEIFNGVKNINDPMVKQMVQDHYAQQYPTLFQKPFSSIDQNTGVMGQIGGMELNPEMALYAPGKYGYAAPKDGWSNTTVADASALGDKMREANKNDVLAPDKNGNMVPTGSSAKTQYMMVNGTMETAAKALVKQDPQTYGTDWKNIKLTPQNTEAMARYTFDQIPHDTQALSKVWTSLRPEDLNAIAQSGYNWDVARPMIIARENGTTVDALAKKGLDQQQAQLAAVTGNAQQAAANPLVTNYNTFMKANSGNDADAAAKFAIANSPAMQGANPLTVADNIRALIRNAKDANGKAISVSPDQAALALVNSIHDDQFGSGVGRWLHNTTDTNSNKISSFNGRHIDLGQAASKLTEVARPDTASQAETFAKTQTAMRMAPLVNADFQAKYAHYQDMARAYKLDPTNQTVAQNYAEAVRNLRVSSAYQGMNDRDAMLANPLSVNTAPSSDNKASQILSQIPFIP